MEYRDKRIACHKLGSLFCCFCLFGLGGHHTERWKVCESWRRVISLIPFSRFGVCASPYALTRSPRTHIARSWPGPGYEGDPS